MRAPRWGTGRATYVSQQHAQGAQTVNGGRQTRSSNPRSPVANGSEGAQFTDRAFVPGGLETQGDYWSTAWWCRCGTSTWPYYQRQAAATPGAGRGAVGKHPRPAWSRVNGQRGSRPARCNAAAAAWHKGGRRNRILWQAEMGYLVVASRSAGRELAIRTGG